MRLTQKCPSIQHLLFADDSLFLCKATLSDYSNFLHCLELYGKASGQEINFRKSLVTFGADIDPVMKRLIAELLEIENEGGAGTDLGLPECFSGAKQKLLAFIGEKLGKKTDGMPKCFPSGERRYSLSLLLWPCMSMPCHAFV